MDKRFDVFTYLYDLPPNVDEIVLPCLDGYTVYINSKLSQAGRLEAYNHAVWHIEHDDWEKCSVQFIEVGAHGTKLGRLSFRKI